MCFCRQEVCEAEDLFGWENGAGQESPASPFQTAGSFGSCTVTERACCLSFSPFPAFRAAMLSHGKGAAFHVHPSDGTLNAFQELTVVITAYNNMWGHYKDVLVCKVSGLPEPVEGMLT